MMRLQDMPPIENDEGGIITVTSGQRAISLSVQGAGMTVALRLEPHEASQLAHLLMAGHDALHPDELS